MRRAKAIHDRLTEAAHRNFHPAHEIMDFVSVYAMAVEHSPDGQVVDEFRSAWGFDIESAKNSAWGRDLDRIFGALAVVASKAFDVTGREAPPGLAPVLQAIRLQAVGNGDGPPGPASAGRSSPGWAPVGSG